ncbi:MAG: hypothetical protein KAJ54_00675 [Candidatus Aenigmarchaeota archaeon]|nr:hypothetical protein [Candidatus Aenigmarchaeota archaeon]MCK5321729.1 hypothetical protein [Candidatus Aenigmarchaeota archaeon]
MLLDNVFSKKTKSVIKQINTTTTDLMENFNAQLKSTIRYTVKSLMSTFIVLLGLVFFLIGIAKTIETMYPEFSGGIGYIMVGSLIIIVGLIATKVKIVVEK